VSTQEWANKLQCYITLDWKGLLRTNALAYWAQSCVTKSVGPDFKVDLAKADLVPFRAQAILKLPWGQY